MVSLQEQIKSACEHNGEVHFREGYSGRGMFGDRCIGVVGKLGDIQAVIAHVVKWEAEEYAKASANLDGDFEEDEEVIEEDTEIVESFDQRIDTLLCGQRQDSMGLDVIVYWPSLEAIEE